MVRENKGDVSWYLNGQKRPFAYSTIAESDTIKILLEEFGDLRVILKSDRLLSPQEKHIIQTLVDNGEYQPNLE